jgi:nucleoside-diphosphate-sugar epimerase
VFHEAALVNVPASIEHPTAAEEINVRGTVNIFEAARREGVRAVVWASSTAVYGNSAVLPNVETMPLDPLSPYAASKASGEMFARAYYEVFKLPVVGLRYFNVYGKRQDPASPYAAVIPLFIDRILNGRSATIYGDGGQTRDFVHVSDVVRANLLAADSASGCGGRAFNIGSGCRISISRLYEMLNAELGGSLRPVHGPARSGEVRDSVADISAARDAFGYEPGMDFGEGLRETVAWFRNMHTTQTGNGR